MIQQLLYNHFTNQETKDQHSEIRREISCYIADTRGYKDRMFRIPNDYDILDSLFRLYFYVFNNFEVPPSHYSYIDGNFKGINSRSKKAIIINQLLEVWRKIDDIYGIELELRAIEVIFSFGRFPITIEHKSIIISYLNDIRNGLDRTTPLDVNRTGLYNYKKMPSYL